ncbi:rhomboid family intramembrane serine protease [Thermotoga sp. SG1]|uniref:rhomboid family intramembrane serine protease n=1 Tax=Thermotoga sp. SG1 TaxID=126739 RepID=UPI000C7731D8|nr:rhomboid family intramembrane serine protease [Thermotoga sp. SG1]PLV56127.1 rhomboid family intramembrane serine protease [Thermotoga sp. SG1]
MFPLYDVLPSRKSPYITIALIVVNVIVFIYELILNDRELLVFMYRYGLVPARYTVERVREALGFSLFPFISHMFLHGGFWHLLGNMWFLWIFGDNTEDEMGHVGYLLFYLSAGVFAALTQFVFTFHSTTPMVGASGAVSGVMGAYFVLFPYSRIVTLFPFFFFLTLVEIPAFYYLMIWFFIQVMNSLVGSYGVAWWAHIGGFVYGMLWGYILRMRRYRRYRY